MVKFLKFYPSEFHKRESIGYTPLFFEAESSLLMPDFFVPGLEQTLPSDSYRRSRISALGVAMPSEIIEVKNEIGEGGLEAIVQAERDYVWLHSSDKVSSSHVTVIFFTAVVNTTLPSVFCHPKDITLSDISHRYQWALHIRVRRCLC